MSWFKSSSDSEFSEVLKSVQLDDTRKESPTTFYDGRLVEEHPSYQELSIKKESDVITTKPLSALIWPIGRSRHGSIRGITDPSHGDEALTYPSPPSWVVDLFTSGAIAWIPSGNTGIKYSPWTLRINEFIPLDPSALCLAERALVRERETEGYDGTHCLLYLSTGWVVCVHIKTVNSMFGTTLGYVEVDEDNAVRVESKPQENYGDTEHDDAIAP